MIQFTIPARWLKNEEVLARRIAGIVTAAFTVQGREFVPEKSDSGVWNLDHTNNWRFYVKEDDQGFLDHRYGRGIKDDEWAKIKNFIEWALR